MFIQVIQGRTSDPEALHRRFELWDQELKPGAIGYLGSGGGCTPDGSCVVMARFETRDAAERNSRRPEQTAWWLETEKCFDGPVHFHDTEDVELMLHGRIDDAHFIQVMEGHVQDRARVTQLEADADGVLAEVRPDLLGSVVAYYGDDEFTDVAYFSSESAAREGEQKPMPPEFAERFAEWERLMKVEQYLDIPEPLLITSS